MSIKSMIYFLCSGSSKTTYGNMGQKLKGCIYYTTFTITFIGQLPYASRIISRGLYIFYPIIHCGLYRRAVIITDHVYTEKGNPSIFGPKIRGL